MILMQICTEKEYNNWLNNKLIAKFDPSTLEFQGFVSLSKAKRECLYNFDRWYVTSCTSKDVNLSLEERKKFLVKRPDEFLKRFGFFTYKAWKDSAGVDLDNSAIFSRVQEISNQRYVVFGTYSFAGLE